MTNAEQVTMATSVSAVRGIILIAQHFIETLH